MSKSLLDSVNQILTRAQVLDSDVGLLTSLTDSARQGFIDVAVQVVNEVMDELYSVSETSKPTQLKEATITLVTNDQDYSLATDLVVLRREYGLIDQTNNHTIPIMDEDGYRQIIFGDIEQNDTGLPTYAVIRPTDGLLLFDKKPTSTYNGRIYKYRFDRDMVLTVAADVFPFTDEVFRAVIPAASELWKLNNHRDFQQGLFDASIGRAARLLRKMPPRGAWRSYGYDSNPTDPLEE